jgi:hypothetical protein
MKMLNFLIFLLAPLLFASDYSVKPVEVLPIDSYPARVTVDKITIAADPYPDNEKSFTAFDVKNLNSRGFFPINIIFRNDSQYYLKLKTQNIVLETRLGELLYSTPAAMVVEDLVGGKYVDSLSHLKDGERLSDTVASPLSDFTSKGLNNTLLEPGMVHSGFLFFYTEKHKRSLFIGSTLHIPNLKEEGTDKNFGPFDIRLDSALSDSKE